MAWKHSRVEYILDIQSKISFYYYNLISYVNSSSSLSCYLLNNKISGCKSFIAASEQILKILH